MTIKMVLDSSAALSYSMGAPQVGEALAELFEEPDWRFAVPARRWRQLVELSRLLGSPKWAQPFLLATANDAYLLTATPERYPDADRVIDISQNRP